MLINQPKCLCKTLWITGTEVYQLQCLPFMMPEQQCQSRIRKPSGCLQN